MWDEAAHGAAFDHAVGRAVQGCDAGLIAHRLMPERMEAALVLAPEVSLAKAMAMLPACAVGFQNALGVLAPPEVAVHLDWDGGIRINGAACGRFRVMASGDDGTAVPDWLVVGFSLPLLPGSEDGGLTPDQTALYAEGCAEVHPPALVEAWARHTLNWITRWDGGDAQALHEEWRGLAWGIGEEVSALGQSGTFLGIDEDFGMLLRSGDDTQLIPLTRLLEDAP
ncbi:biotin/lipoate--protein ligase family protein [Mesobacterium pallidum]|uniref:biotin/lipoate--protein ligase family protein n=1 Tax=Mesobacterium pallidum TaxID=2872037 RepID=UPI001EE1FF5B|nr:biotin/lipoate--protein ligase family protein [Mesobacterium pallidum]